MTKNGCLKANRVMLFQLARQEGQDVRERCDLVLVGEGVFDAIDSAVDKSDKRFIGLAGALAECVEVLNCLLGIVWGRVVPEQVVDDFGQHS